MFLRRLFLALLALCGVVAFAGAAAATHLPGVTYDGTAASGGTVSFDVSADGAAVTQFRVKDVPTSCGTVTSTSTGTFTIAGEAFSYGTSGTLGLRFSGSFTGPKTATGTVSFKFAYPSCTSTDIGWTAATSAEILAVARAGSGSGAVTSVPAGISCGSTCSHAYANGTKVTLTAHPATGSTFGGWSGACSGTGTCVLAMTADRSVTATFTARCTVPGVQGKLLATAKTAIVNAGCAVGTIGYAYSATVGKGRVVSQKPAAGTKVAKGTKVALVVSKGKRPA